MSSSRPGSAPRATASITLLLTGTIDVRGMSHVARSSTEVRLNDYTSALSSWLTAFPSLPIVFCENSGHDLARIHETIERHNAGARVECISFRAPEYPREKGKGYGETGLIEFALENSSRLAAPAGWIVKATGRYFMRNYAILHSMLEQRPDLDVVANLSNRLRVADSRVFAARGAFYTNFLLPRREEMNDADGSYFEHALARAIHDAMANSWEWDMLPSSPIIDGVSGTVNHSYGGRLQHVIAALRHRIKDAALGNAPRPVSSDVSTQNVNVR